MKHMVATVLMSVAVAAVAQDKSGLGNADRKHYDQHFSPEAVAQRKAQKPREEKPGWLEEEGAAGIPRWKLLLIGALAAAPVVVVVRRK